MKREMWIAAAAAVLVLVSGCKGSHNQNSTDARALNAVVDAEPLDILIDDDVKVTGLALGSTSSFADFTAGSRDLKIRSSTSQTVLIEKTQDFGSGSNSTLLMYGKRSSILTQLLTDDTTSPSSGHFRVRVANLASDTSAVDLYVTAGAISSSGAVISAAGFGAVTGAAEVASGSLRVTLTSSGTQDILFQSAPQTFSDGTNITIVVLPTLGGKLVNAVVLGQGSSSSGTLLANPLARVKAVNGVPDSTALNFKADGTVLLSSVPYLGSSSYVTTASGTHTLQVEASNVPGTTIASLAKQMDPARDYTALAVGNLAAVQLVAITDDNSLPVPGFAKLRFVNAQTGSTGVDVLVNFASQTSGLAFPTASTYYQLAPSLTYTITFSTPGGITVISTLTPVELDAGAVYTAYLFGTQAAPQARLVRDR
jgi:Domain of unknown function (DUF4397)